MNTMMHWGRRTVASLLLGLLGACGGNAPPQAIEKPELAWIFEEFLSDGLGPALLDSGTQTGGPLFLVRDFGPAAFDQSDPPPAGDGVADGRISVNESGTVYFAYAQAPVGNIAAAIAEPIGSVTILRKSQTYRKMSAGGKLELVITRAAVQAIDANGKEVSQLECPVAADRGTPVCNDTMHGIVDMFVKVYNFKRLDALELRSGRIQMSGWQDHWAAQVSVPPFEGKTVSPQVTLLPVKPLWTAKDFVFDGDVGRDGTGTNGLFQLAEPERRVSLDLSEIAVGEKFFVHVTVRTSTFNHRGRESYVAAFLRDPIATAEPAGFNVQMSGVEPVDDTPPDVADPAASAAPPCAVPDAGAGTLQFSAPAYSMLEWGAAQSPILVTRIGGSRGRVSAFFTTADGTARAGSDYTAVSGHVVFEDGDAEPRLMPLPVLPDRVAEPDKTVQLALTAPGGCATLGAQASATLNLLDDDRPPPLTAFTLGGTVTGLAGSGLTLTDLGEDLGVAINGSFAFAQPLADGLPYTVSVKAQPTNPSQVCSVGNASGTVRGANITNVTVDCVTPPPNGSLDTSFGSGGTVFSSQLSPSDASSALARQADGKLVVAGRNFAAMRFNADGSVDTGFGVAGKASAVFAAGSTDEARGVAVQADGRIVVVGHSRTGVSASGRDFALARFHSDGSLDTSFGTAGLVRTDFNAELDEAQAVAIQADGKIVVAGNSRTSVTAKSTFALARYNVDGSLDTTFGSAGKVTFDLSGGTSLGRSLAVQPDGRIVVAGSATLANSAVLDQTGVARFDAAGRIDASFGTGGTVLIAMQGGDHVVVQADGKLLLPGSVAPTPFTPRDFALVRLNADGRTDTGFGSSGTASVDFGGTEDRARAAVVQADGRIVVVGSRFDPLVPFSAGFDFALARFDATGQIDASFGAGGRLTLDFFAGPDIATSVLVQPDGRLVVAGSARSGNTAGTGLARVQP